MRRIATVCKLSINLISILIIIILLLKVDCKVINNNKRKHTPTIITNKQNFVDRKEEKRYKSFSVFRSRCLGEDDELFSSQLFMSVLLVVEPDEVDDDNRRWRRLTLLEII